jgi:DNA-binding NtrC family response regulator
MSQLANDLNEIPHNAKSILVIESNDHIRQLICINLIKRGYLVHKTATLGEALPFLSAVRPGIALIELPYYEDHVPVFLRQINNEPMLARVPIIAVGNFDWRYIDLHAVNPNVAAVLPKPMSAYTLVSTVERVLNC